MNCIFTETLQAPHSIQHIMQENAQQRKNKQQRRIQTLHAQRGRGRKEGEKGCREPRRAAPHRLGIHGAVLELHRPGVCHEARGQHRGRRLQGERGPARYRPDPPGRVLRGRGARLPTERHQGAAMVRRAYFCGTAPRCGGVMCGTHPTTSAGPLLGRWLMPGMWW